MKHNRRILLVDDTPSIHEDFRKILCPRASAPELDAAESFLFGTSPPPPAGFELDAALQGAEGVAQLEAALANGRPYALAFIDMRMPPGWDGLETVERLWRADPRLQVVICTAYTDCSWEELHGRAELRDRLLVVKKPFDMVEVLQLAHALTAKWTLAREAEARQEQLEATVRRLQASESEWRCAARELETFAWAVAHDLKSPLARIQGFSALLAEQMASQGDKAAHYAARVEANAALGQELVSGLLTLSDVVHGHLAPAPVDLSGLASQVLRELQLAAPWRRARVRVAPGLTAHGDAQLLRIAVANLLENAWKFTSRRAMSVIEVGRHAQDAQHDVFFVRDNGCGFDMAQADGLFHRFHRLHHADEYPGTGLGLVTVNRVLARHGGRIWAEAAPDAGSTFLFSLPHPADAQRRAAAPALSGTDE